MPIRIVTVPVRELESFLTAYLARGEQPIAPLTLARARSQSRNPAAGEKDIGLLVAFEAERCVGYQGLVPGFLHAEDGRHNVYWCSAAFVHPEFRSRMVAVRLLQKVVGLGRDVVVTNYNDDAERLLRALHFRPLGTLTHLKLELEKLNLLLLGMRLGQKIGRRLRMPDVGFDTAIGWSRKHVYPWVRAHFYRRLQRQVAPALRGIQCRALSRVEGPARTATTKTGFPLTAESLNWILQNPWRVAGETVEQSRFYFAGGVDLFRYYLLEYGAGKHIAFSVTRRQGTTVIKWVDGENDPAACALFADLACRHHADTWELPLSWESWLRDLPGTNRLIRRAQRGYLCYPASPSSPLARHFDRIELGLSDGETVFS